MKHILGAILFLILMSTLAFASPTVYGPTGLVTMPNAEGLKYKEFNVGLNYLPPYNRGVENDEGDTIGEDKYPYLNYYGNLGTFEGFEIGFSGKGGREGVFINMKYYLISDTSENPLSMAIGLQNLSSFTETGLYMVTSKQINMNVGLHFGFLGRFDPYGADTNMMFGIKYLLNDQWAMLVDTVGIYSVYSWNVGMQVQLGETMALNMAGLNIINPSPMRTSVFTIGLSITGFM
jgi:hypothetical protein